MKVVVIGKDRFESLEYHLMQAFGQLGHQAMIVDPLKFTIYEKYGSWFIRFNKKYDAYVHRKAAEAVVRHKPDLVVCAYRSVHPLAIDYIKKELPGCKAVQLNPDALINFENQQVFVSPFDHHFTKDPFILRFMRDKLNLPVHYLPECFNHEMHKRPEYNKKVAEDKVNKEVITMGAGYPYRALMLKQLVDAGIPLTVYGNIHEYRYTPEFMKDIYANEYLVGDRKSEVLFGAKVIFNNLHYSEVEGVNCKFFEIIGCGGFQIMDYKPTIKDYIPADIDPSLFTFNTVPEAIDKIRYYLQHDNERIEIANRLHEHGLQHHTYQIRMQQMLDIIYQ